jgi:hypothetical protein
MRIPPINGNLRSTSPQTRGGDLPQSGQSVADDAAESPPPRWLVLHRMAEVLQSKKQLAAEEHAAEEALQLEREVAAMKNEQRMLTNRRLRSNSTGGGGASAAITPRGRQPKSLVSAVSTPQSGEPARTRLAKGASRTGEADIPEQHSYQHRGTSAGSSRSSSAAAEHPSNSGAIVYKRKVAPELEALLVAARSRSGGGKSTTSDVVSVTPSNGSRFVKHPSSSTTEADDEVVHDARAPDNQDYDDVTSNDDGEAHADTPPPQAESSAPPKPSPLVVRRRRGSGQASSDEDPQQPSVAASHFSREEYVPPAYSFQPTITRGPRHEYYEQRGLTVVHDEQAREAHGIGNEVLTDEYRAATNSPLLNEHVKNAAAIMTREQEDHAEVVAAVSPSYETLEAEVTATTPPPSVTPTVQEVAMSGVKEVLVDIAPICTANEVGTHHHSVQHPQDAGPRVSSDGADVGSSEGRRPPSVNDTMIVLGTPIDSTATSTTGLAEDRCDNVSRNATGGCGDDCTVMIAPLQSREAPVPVLYTMHNESGRLYNDVEEALLPSPVSEGLLEETRSDVGDDRDSQDACHEQSPRPSPAAAAETPRAKHDDDEEAAADEVVYSPRSAMEAILREGEAALEAYERQNPPPPPSDDDDGGAIIMEDVPVTAATPTVAQNVLADADVAVQKALVAHTDQQQQLHLHVSTPVSRRAVDDHLTEIPTILRDPHIMPSSRTPHGDTPSPVIVVGVVGRTSPPRNTQQQQQQYHIDVGDDDDVVVYQQATHGAPLYQSNHVAAVAVSVQNTLPTNASGPHAVGVVTTPVDAGRGNHLPVPLMNSFGSPTPPTTARSNATPTVVDSESEWAFHGLSQHTMMSTAASVKQSKAAAAPIAPKSRWQPHDRSDSVDFNFSIHSDVGAYSNMHQQVDGHHHEQVPSSTFSSAAEYAGPLHGRRHRWGDASPQPVVAAHRMAGGDGSLLHSDDTAAFVSHSRTQSVEHDELLQAFGGKRAAARQF